MFHKGQWVLTVEPLVTANGGVIPTDTLGVAYPIAPDAESLEFHQIDPVDGFGSIRMVPVNASQVVPLKDRERIPAPRLAKMDPDWRP